MAARDLRGEAPLPQSWWCFAGRAQRGTPPQAYPPESCGQPDINAALSAGATPRILLPTGPRPALRSIPQAKKKPGR